MKVKNLLVANVREKDRRYKFKKIEILVKAQIENSIEVGWRPSNIILLANFDYEFMGVKAINISLNEFCFTGSKTFAVEWLFDSKIVDGPVWAHDLDAWQNVWFDCPEFLDVGATYYSRPKFNGGSVFWRPSSIDIIKEAVQVINEKSENKEEPTLNKLFKSDKYKDRVTILNESYNVGCSGFVPRYNRSIKPIRVCHFHPYNRIAWETHVLDRNGIDEIPVMRRLENLLRRYYPKLATELQPDGKAKADNLRKIRLEELRKKQ
jgi:hypothetical protein